MRHRFLFPACLALAACSPSLPIARFADTAPDFDPVSFFTGHTRSWGVLENRSGQPTGIVTTDCMGDPEGSDGLHMVQHLTLPDGGTQMRDWHMRRTAPHMFEATANDMVGAARGEARGRVFHWRWVLATKPGDALRDVVMDQWMYGEANGAMVNRTTIRKLGVILAEVTEQFEHAPR
jgi:hypothetical protein